MAKPIGYAHRETRFARGSPMRWASALLTASILSGPLTGGLVLAGLYWLLDSDRIPPRMSLLVCVIAQVLLIVASVRVAELSRLADRPAGVVVAFISFLISSLWLALSLLTLYVDHRIWNGGF